ncbi:MAG TPA: 30S ribosomal protein S6 [Nitriliruptorales bacterium]
MRRYEMMVILTDELDEDGANGLIDRFRSAIADNGGSVVDEIFWGKRKFTYEIDHRWYGWYHVFDVEATDEGLSEVERLMRINDNVVRFKTIRPELHVHRTKTKQPA